MNFKKEEKSVLDFLLRNFVYYFVCYIFTNFVSPFLIIGGLRPTDLKAQNFGKSKKNRKSPTPNDFENTQSNRSEDVQSPAYSDISDDSSPVVDSTDLSGKYLKNNNNNFNLNLIKIHF